jgi:hypothetical protein
VNKGQNYKKKEKMKKVTETLRLWTKSLYMEQRGVAGRFDDPDQTEHRSGIIWWAFYERIALFMQEEPASRSNTKLKGCETPSVSTLTESIQGISNTARTLRGMRR